MKTLADQVLEHTAKRQEELEVNLTRSVAMKSFDVIALESIRLGIETWHEMPFGDLRKEIKRLQELEKKP